MTEDTFENKPDPDEYIVQWAYWWAITERALLGLPSGTIERSRANTLHREAAGNLRHSLGIADKGRDHG